MSEDKWEEAYAKTLGVFLNDLGFRGLDERGQKMTDQNFFLIFNAEASAVDFKIVPESFEKEWQKVFDTSVPAVTAEAEQIAAGSTVSVPGRSIIVLQCDPPVREGVPQAGLPEISERG